MYPWISGNVDCFFRTYGMVLRKQVSENCIKWPDTRVVANKCRCSPAIQFRSSLIFINGQSADILSTFNLFADDILFSVAYDPEISEYELNQGLKKIYGSVFSGKCHLSQILTMRFRKLYFQENLQNHLTFRSVSTMHLLLVLISRSM